MCAFIALDIYFKYEIENKYTTRGNKYTNIVFSSKVAELYPGEDLKIFNML